MLICIPNVLSSEEVQKILADLLQGHFADGSSTAGATGQGIKFNLEFQRPENKPTEIDRLVMTRLMENETFQDFAMPKHIAPPIFSKYDIGMEYGVHVDSPLMGQKSVIRSDLSLTLFLSDPASYEGGELTIQAGFGEQEIKLAAGDAVVYQSTSLHRVKPVTHGTRFVALSWLQSFIQDEGMREILYDLTVASRRFSEILPAGVNSDLTDVRDHINKAYANLMRRQADV